MGEWHIFSFVSSTYGVYLMDSIESPPWKALREFDEGSPQILMDVRNPTFGEGTHQDDLGVSNALSHLVDFVALRMSPPAPRDRLSRDLCSQRRL